MDAKFTFLIENQKTQSSNNQKNPYYVSTQNWSNMYFDEKMNMHVYINNELNRFGSKVLSVLPHARKSVD